MRAEDEIFIMIKKDEFIDLIEKNNKQIYNDIRNYRRKTDGSATKIKRLKSSIRYNKSMIKEARKDDDYLIYYLSRDGTPGMMRVTLEYKKRIYDMGEDSKVAYV